MSTMVTELAEVRATPTPLTLHLSLESLQKLDGGLDTSSSKERSHF
ncbi:hypothetical protein PQG02_00685 [Nostoc sp. UHCC 0926]|nr:hypothetical protein PQG02_00685 [Nostoc sp. UHCC 0926]